MSRAIRSRLFQDVARLTGGSRSTTTNTADSTLGGSALANIVGFYMTGDGPTAINPSAVGPDGRGVASDGSPFFTGQVFYNSPAGTLGQLQRRSFYGPCLSIGILRYRRTSYQRGELCTIARRSVQWDESSFVPSGRREWRFVHK